MHSRAHVQKTLTQVRVSQQSLQPLPAPQALSHSFAQFCDKFAPIVWTLAVAAEFSTKKSFRRLNIPPLRSVPKPPQLPPRKVWVTQNVCVNELQPEQATLH
jgi:hypothetical protein